MSNLLATKLRRPSVLPTHIPRPHLIQTLNESLESGRALTLVSAPAGFGKTTAMVEWAEGLETPVTWLSLDTSDDDPGRFFTYLIAALQKVGRDLGKEIEGVLRAGRLPPLEILSTVLINDILACQTQFILVLDDFQLVQDHYILGFFENLVTHLLQVHLSQPMHLALITREDPPLPLARLRAKNRITEIRARDLRFTGPEAARFLNEVMRLGLDETDVAALEERTEGWIAGLQLAAIAINSMKPPGGLISGQGEVSSFIARLSGNHRYILGYLTEEVLNRQPENIRQFLLETSILNRLSGDLCDAVTSRTDSDLLLEQLSAANLFLIPLDNQGNWYRYHHLFSDLLSDLLAAAPQEKTVELHRRAARWYTDDVQNESAKLSLSEHTAFVSEAIRHALAASEYDLAVRLIDRHAITMLMQWHVKTLAAWLQAIPAEWGRQSPRANLAFVWMYLLRGDYVQALPYVERLQAIFSQPEAGADDSGLMAEWLALQSMLLNAQGRREESLGLAQQAREILPEDQKGNAASMVYLALAGAYRSLRDNSRSAQAYQFIIQHGRAEDDLVAELLGISGLALMAIERGQLHYGFELASEGIERAERSGSLLPISSAVYGEVGQILYQWGQTEQAKTFFERSIQVSKLSGYSDAEIYYGVVLSRLHLREGSLAAAAREIQKIVELMQVDAPAAVREETIAQQVQVYLAQGRLAAAETALKDFSSPEQGKFQLPELKDPGEITDSDGLLYNSALRILLYRAQTRGELEGLRPGLELAGRLLAALLEGQYILSTLQTLLLRAQLYATEGDEAASEADTIRALELGEPEGFISVFIDEGPVIAKALQRLLQGDRIGAVLTRYVKTILAKFPGSADGAARFEPQPDLVEPLTDRELEVLNRMAEGLTYAQIAERLFVSLNTVRTHVKSVYGKLNVNNRTKAIALARQMKLIGPMAEEESSHE